MRRTEMKKIILVVVLAVLIQGVSLFAQEKFTTESDYYYYNVPIEKIYAHRLGYVVIYRKGVNLMTRTYLPIEWFTDTAGIGEVYSLGPGKEWPSMTVYYKDGEFSHVRLRLRRSRAHETWGVVPLNANIDQHFKGVSEVKLEF